VGSGNPYGFDGTVDDEHFFPYYIVKDLYAVLLFFIAFGFVVFFYPNALGHPDNYVPANPLVTPTHIVPEWYFLPFYAILRSIPNKIAGVFFMIFAIVSIGAVPIAQKPNLRSMEFRPSSRFFFWWFVSCCFILGWIGSQTAKYPYVEIGQYASFFYFFYFWFIAPIVIYFENVFGPAHLPTGKLILHRK
jgi:ubiquinol-cytochrome c reductase cytochrome b subunit